MKKNLKRAYRLALIFPLIFLFVVGCQKDLVHPELGPDAPPSLSIEEAQNFFEKNVIQEGVNKQPMKEDAQKFSLSNLFNLKTTVWKQAYNTVLSNGGNAVRVPLLINENMYWKYNDGPQSNIRVDLLNYLFMYKDSASSIRAEWVTLMPDSTWLQGNRNNYIGKILIKKWDGTQVRLYDFSKAGRVDEFDVENSSTSVKNGKSQGLVFQTACYLYGCPGSRLSSGNGRLLADCYETLECETVITGSEPTTGGWDPWGGYNYSDGGYSGGNGGSGSSSGGGNNYTPQCNPNIPPGTQVHNNQLPPCIPITPANPWTNLPVTPVSYSDAEMQTIIENLNDPVTGEGISLFLVENYRGTKAIKAVYSQVAGENITVGAYTLAKNYDSNGNLISYYAWRNGDNGVEYMIKANQLNAFIQNIDYYTSAANLAYFNGPPSRSMIALMSGDYVSGLVSMWGDALSDPNYYIYVANVLVMSSANIKPNNITYRNVTTGVSIPNFEITSHTFSEYKNLIQQKLGGTWQTVATTPQGPIQVLEVGGVKYNARPIASNPTYNLTIDYFRNGKKIGEFRFPN